MKKGKKIWCDGRKWTIHEVIRPNKFDLYLVVFSEIEDETHENGVIPIEYICINVYDEEFYPDTKFVEKIMTRRRIEFDKKVEREWDENQKLTSLYLEFTE